MVKVNFKKLDKNAHPPTSGAQFAAGADLYALTGGETVRFAPGETKMIRTGLAVEIPEGYAGLIYARSGIATKRGLAPANKVGVIDSDYRGEVMVSLHNHSGAEQEIADGERSTACDSPVFSGGVLRSRRAFGYSTRRRRLWLNG